MLPDPDAIDALLAVLQARGVHRFRFGEVSVEMGPMLLSPRGGNSSVSTLASPTQPAPPSPEVHAAVQRAAETADDAPMTDEEREYYAFLHGHAPAAE